MNVWITIPSDVIVTTATIVSAVFAARSGAMPQVRWVAVATAAVGVLVAGLHITLLTRVPAWFEPPGGLGGLLNLAFVALLLTCAYVALHCLFGRHWAQTPEFRVTAIWNGIGWAISIAYLLAGTLWPWASLALLPVLLALVALVVIGQVRGLQRLKRMPGNPAA